MKIHLHPVIALVLCALLWSFGGLMVKLVQWDAVAIAGVRSLLGMAVICIVFRRLPHFFVRASDGTIDRRQTMNLLIGGVFYAATMLMFVPATKLTTAANAILLQYTNPIYIILFGPILLKEKNDWIDYVAVVGIMAGMLLLLSGDLDVAHVDRQKMIGNLLALGSGVAYGFTTMFLRRQKDGHPADSLTLAHLIAVVFSIPFVIRAGTPAAASCIGLLILGVFQIGIPSMLLALGIAGVPALSSVIITMIEPMMNPVWVALFVGEVPSPLAICGGVLILLCIVLHVVLKTKKAAREQKSLGNTKVGK
ncbi:MAG: DMT family transporter [Treponema sp.]|nr:DMT family transporter [Treponema sp.]